MTHSSSPWVDDFVSVITPAFNSEKFIGDCIRSVQTQSYKDWEMLVAVDAGTTDRTIEIVNEFSDQDSRIKLIHIPNARGISLSRNAAIDQARGRYIAFLDSDDLWLPYKLERQLQFMKARKAPYSCTGYRRLSEDGLTTGAYIGVADKIDYEWTLRNNTIGCPTIILDRNHLGTVYFVEGRHEDYILNLDILKRGFACHGLNEDLSRYRFVHNSRSRMIYTSLLTRWNIYRQREKLSLLQSIWMTMNYIYYALDKRRSF